MKGQMTHSGLPAGMTRWDLLKMIQTGRSVLGLSKGAAAYLCYIIRSTQDADYEPGRICAYWGSVTDISGDPEVSLDRRQVSRHEGNLDKQNFISKNSSAHSRRTGLRKNGVIKYEYGINLAPLIERAEEIRAASRKAKYEQHEAKSLRQRIRKLFSDIRRLENETACDAATKILPNRKPSTVQKFDRLSEITDALEAVFEDFSQDLGVGEMSHQKDISPTRITKEKKNIKTCSAVASNKHHEMHTTPAMAVLLSGRRVRELIQFYATGVGGIHRLCWNVIELAARDRAHEHEISEGTWRYLCDQIGSERTALCMIVADRNGERSDKHRVRNVAGAFVRMVQKGARDEAIIDRLTGELYRYCLGMQNGT